MSALFPIGSKPIRKLCIVGTHHQFQCDDLMHSYFDSNLLHLIDEYRIDTICEEGSGLPPKSCVEVLADALGLKWKNIDLTIEERKLVPDKGDNDQIQDLDLHEAREKVWVERISDVVDESGLLICGLCHTFTIAQKLRELFDLKIHVYSPQRIYNWLGRPTVTPKKHFQTNTIS